MGVPAVVGISCHRGYRRQGGQWPGQGTLPMRDPDRHLAHQGWIVDVQAGWTLASQCPHSYMKAQSLNFQLVHMHQISLTSNDSCWMLKFVDRNENESIFTHRFTHCISQELYIDAFEIFPEI